MFVSHRALSSRRSATRPFQAADHAGSGLTCVGLLLPLLNLKLETVDKATIV